MTERSETSRPGTALITGGGTGVGAATARLLATRGWSVAINYSRSADAAEAVAAECRTLGVAAHAFQADVADDGECRSLVARSFDALGGLDLLVNSAGTTQLVALTDLDAQNAADLQRVFAVNTVGAYQIARAARPPLEQSGRGSIVNVSSIAGQTGSGSSLAYVLSKGALNTLTLSLARLFAPKIRVNAVLPGMIDTGWFASAGMSQETFGKIRKSFAENSALGDISDADDIARAIYYLGVEASRITGQFLTVDAGLSLGKPPVPSN